MSPKIKYLLNIREKKKEEEEIWSQAIYIEIIFVIDKYCITTPYFNLSLLLLLPNLICIISLWSHPYEKLKAITINQQKFSYTK